MKKSTNNIESDPFLMPNYFNYKKQKVAKDKPNTI